MKKLATLLSAFLLLSVVAFAQAQIEVKKETHDFGKIPQGVPVTNGFEVKNNGNEPLIISNVQTTCGCTVPEWTKEPIMPGQTGTVKAQFNAAARGKFHKSVTIVSNASNGPFKLNVAGEVVDKNELDGAPANKTGFSQ